MKLMIVDDNKMFRQAFLNLLDWKLLGFDHLVEAINGVQALELLEDNPVDIVVTDMSMPEMDGVELIKRLVYLYPKTRVLALSNYDDFTFVKEALMLGAQDYMLKHEMSPAGMMTTIKSCIEGLNTESKSDKHATIMQYLEIDSFAGKMLYGQLSDEEIYSGVRQYTHKTTFEQVIMVLVQQADGNRDPYLFREWLERNAKDDYMAFQASAGKGVHVLIYNLRHISSELKIQRLIRDMTNRLNAHGKNSGYKLYIGVSGVGKGLKSMTNMYRQAQVAREHLIYEHHNTVKQYTTDMIELEEVSEPSQIIGTSLYQEHIMKNRNAYTEEIRGIFSDIQQNPLDRCSLEKVMFEMSTVLIRLSKTLNVNIYELLEEGKNLPQLINEHYRLEDKRRFILTTVDNIYSKAHNYSEVVNSDVREIMRHIDERYRDELNLKTIAEAFGFSANYLSSLFKQETGHNMTDYIKAVRIRYAKSYILERTYKTYEIAKMSGFKNTSYFCTVFKDVTGMSPKEYKDSH